jgi:hypothetical protein
MAFGMTAPVRKPWQRGEWREPTTFAGYARFARDAGELLSESSPDENRRGGRCCEQPF